ncbi:MAG: cupin domain-containing protein [Acidobacteria bacterium]|nr:cupin domain-containing protein [Acidobacteriota bacterium]
MMQTRKLPDTCTVLAPDGSEIRELVAVQGGSLVHCRLPPGATSEAVAHATVEEVWYVIEGRGQVWRAHGTAESVVDVSPGAALSIETGCRFQFRNTGDGDLCLLIVTMPPWPGAHEARPAPGRWPATSG